jgi:PH domain
VCAGKEFLTSLNSGFLRKRGHRFKNWKRRFFVLHADSLTYSERQGSKIKGQVESVKFCRIPDGHQR